MIRAIPQTYNGIQMRSRAEARVATWLDSRNIKWEYECEGYDVEGVWYLPDFYLPDLKTFIEVKGQIDSDDRSLLKPLKLASCLPEGFTVYLVEPNMEGYILYKDGTVSERDFIGALLVDRVELRRKCHEMARQSVQKVQRGEMLSGWQDLADTVDSKVITKVISTLGLDTNLESAKFKLLTHTAVFGIMEYVLASDVPAVLKPEMEINGWSQTYVNGKWFWERVCESRDKSPILMDFDNISYPNLPEIVCSNSQSF